MLFALDCKVVSASILFWSLFGNAQTQTRALTLQMAAKHELDSLRNSALCSRVLFFALVLPKRVAAPSAVELIR